MPNWFDRRNRYNRASASCCDVILVGVVPPLVLHQLIVDAGGTCSPRFVAPIHESSNSTIATTNRPRLGLRRRDLAVACDGCSLVCVFTSDQRHITV